MNNKSLFVGIAAVCAVATFMLSRVIWPDLPNMIQPSSGEIPFFIVLSVLESVSFGIGVSFIIFGWPLMKAKFKGPATLAWLTFLSVAWFLVSWWPHDNLHRTTPEGDYVGLLRIEYGFHFSLMVAGFIVAMFLYRQLKEGAAGQAGSNA